MKNILKEAAPFLSVIALGLAIFLLDLFEFSSTGVRKGILVSLAIFKSGYFLWMLLSRLRRSAGQEFYFHHFARFIAINVFLVMLSFAVDYYCLFRIQPDDFKGLPENAGIGGEMLSFFYFSVSTFTTAGLGDIAPAGMAARAFVTLQLCIGWLCTVLIIGNVAHLRESFVRKK